MENISANNTEKLKNMTVDFNKKIVKVHLHIMNFKNTQVMINKYFQNRDIVIKIENEVIQHVTNYVSKPFHGRRDQAHNKDRMAIIWKGKVHIKIKDSNGVVKTGV